MKRWIVALLCALLIIPSPTALAQEQTVTVEKEVLLSALYEADIASIQQALTLELITSQELTAYYLERIEAYNEPYNCFITLCANALDIAKEKDELRAQGLAEGALFGIPIVVKDNMDYIGFHTTNGHKKKDSQIAESNADVVQSFLDAGAIIIGKTNMSTAAQDALCSRSDVAGETKNAYNTTMASGGSSGGSAVAVSLNFATAALGTDTNSSLRIPAALNGCVSLRPTFGLLSNQGIKRLNSTRDTAGAITRTVYDQALMLDVLTGGTYQYAENLNANALQGLRIGILEELTYPTTKDYNRTKKYIDSEVSAAFEQAVETLRQQGAEVVDVSIPRLFTLSARTFSSGDASYKQALYDAFMQALEEADVSCLIYPSYLTAPIRSGTDENGTYWEASGQINVNNCRTLSPSASLPEISVPIGVHSRGAGMGMEIAAPKNCEQLLLDVAYAFTAHYPRTAPEGAPNSYADDHFGSMQSVVEDYLYRLAESQIVATEPTETTEPQATDAPVATTQEITEKTAEQMQDTIFLYVALGTTGLLAVFVAILLIAQTKKREKIPME